MTESKISPLLEGLLLRLMAREDLELEFKLAKGGLPKSLWETVSAFANTNGGWITLGVDDKQDPPVTVGVPNASNRLQDFFNTVRNPSKISHSPCGTSDAAIEHVDGRDVVVIRVAAAPRRFRPVYLDNSPYRGTFARHHAGDHHCTKQEVDRMMRDASGIAADSGVLKHYSLDDLDQQSFARYRRLYQTANPISPANDLADQEFLSFLRGHRQDRESGDEGLTVAGLLMFGTGAALREWRGRHLIDYRRVSGTVADDVRWDDRVVFEGNLVDAFQVLYPRLIDGLPTPFRLEGPTRRTEGPVQVALREALVNLLVHADYAETQVSLIVRSDEGFLFRNPGSSLVPEADLLSGYRSEPRNPDLVRMFRYVGWAEEAGTGIAKILAAWRELGLRFPLIDPGTERYEFTLDLRYVHLFSDEDRAWLLGLGQDWTEPEQLALVYARRVGSINNAALRSMAVLHPADATKVLGSLRDRSLLEMTGFGRGAQYVLGPATVEAVPDSGSGRLSSGSTGTDSGSTGESSGSNEPNSMDVQEELLRVAEPARAKRRLAPAERDRLFLALCAIATLSVNQLAALVQRNSDWVRDGLRRMMAAGMIEYLYPGQPHHPHQKYVVRTDGAGETTGQDRPAGTIREGERA